MAGSPIAVPDLRGQLTPPIVAFDEAGSTGSELLDPQQPVFAVASVCIPRADALAAIGTLRVQAIEVKFSAVRRHPRRRKRVLQAIEALAPRPNRVKCYVIHKRFMIATKIVDLLVEPVLFAAGQDFYDRRQNLAWANALHAGLPAAVGREGYTDLQRRFVRLLQRPSALTVEDFYGFLHRLANLIAPSPWSPLLDVVAGTRHVAESMMESFSASSLDPAFPALVMLCGEWTRELGQNFVVLHDDSPPLEQQQLYVDALAMKGPEPPRVIGSGSSTMVFPPSIERLEFVSSRQYPEVQVADIIAGSLGYAMRARAQKEPDEFADQVIERLFGHAWIDAIWPDPDGIPDPEPPRAEGAVDPIEYVGKIISKRLKVLREQGGSHSAPE